ncbi:hypothetical protein SESBI_26689 [Sesbania bispinosa]|nr:hypothetical protein SESBI_26689 [Sesbania bispinosa]
MEAVIVKLLWENVSLKFLQARLEKMWKSLGEMELMDMENEYLLVQFSSSEDYYHIFEGGPWMIEGYYLVIQRWRPDFLPNEDQLKKVVVWVHIHGLPIEFYERFILWKIGDTLGRTIKMDSNTLKSKEGVLDPSTTKRAKFARVYIEVKFEEDFDSKVSNSR